MNALDDLLKKKTGGSRTASSGSASGEKPVSYVDALLESKKGGNADSQLLYTNALKASQGQSTMQTPYADAAAQMKSGTNNNFFHGIAGIFEKAAAGAKEGLRTGLNEAGYRAQAANPLNAADDAYYKAMWEQTTGRKTGVEIPADTRTQQQKDLDEYMGVADLKNDRARAMQRAAEKGYERLDKEGVKTAFQRDNTYQERVDQRYADLGPKWQRAMSIAESVGNQALPMAGRLIGTALLGEKGGEAFQSFLFFNQASGAAIEEALEDGASWDKALTYGTVIGSIEAATEAAGDMANKLTIKAAGKYLPKEQFTKALIGTLTSSKTMRTVLTLLGQMNGEGLEEVASDLVSPFAKSIYNGKTLGENWMDDVTIRGLWESYLAGAISGGFLSGIDGAVNGRFRAQNESYANETVNAKIEEARASMKENGLFNSETREKILDAGAELGALETQRQTAAQDARDHMQMIREMQRALRGDVGAQERISRMQEGSYTTGAQNAPVGAQRAQNEGISTTPAAAINIQEGMNNGQSSYHREESGAAYVGSRGQAAEGAEGGLQALAGGRTEVQRGVGTDAQADLRQVTPAQLGIRDGGTETVTVVDAQKLGGEAKSAYDAVRETGLEPVAVRGAIQISNGYANAYTESGRVFFRVDAADSAGNVISPEMLVQHELFHNYASEEVIRATDEVIRESMTAEEYDAMRDAYKADYAGVYDFANMSVDEIERLLTEEIAADAYAGLNWFSGEAPVQEAVRTETERNAPARRTEAQRETTGPPKGRAQAFVGYDAETGRGIYQSNFEENTPKAKKSERVIRLIQDVWSKNPIDLVVENEDGSESIIKAEFDPRFDEGENTRSDAAKLAAGNRHGTAAEKRVTLNLADDFYQIIRESTYSGSKAETGKTSDTHAGVNMWRYFVNPILYMERSGNETTPYTVSIDVKQKDNGNFVYSFHAERDAKNNGQPAPQTLHAAVNGAENDTANGSPIKGSIADIANASALTKTSETSAGTASFAEADSGPVQGATASGRLVEPTDSASMSSIRSTSGNSQEKSSGRASVEMPGDNERIRRNNIEYTDNEARNAAQRTLHDRMVREGKTVDLTENREAASQYFPDLRSMPKAERKVILREKIKLLKDDLRTYLRQIKGASFEFEINGETIEAKLYNTGIQEVLENLTQEKSGMLFASEEIFKNAEYLYSTTDKRGNPEVSGWDYFYVPVKLGDDTAGVRIAVRNMIQPNEAQIYNWGIKKEDAPLGGGGPLPFGSASTGASSDASSNERSSSPVAGTRSANIDSNATAPSETNIRSTVGNSQEKSSGRARDTTSRRRMTAEERKNTPPNLGDADTVFADGSGVSMAYDSNDAARFNPEEKTQDELLHDIMNSAEPFDQRYLYFGRFTDSFRTAMEKAGVEVKNLPVIMSYRDAYLAMESRENGRYQGEKINYHNLGIEGIKSAMENIGKPDAVMKSKKDGKIELFLDFVDYKGNRGLAIVQLDSNAQHAQEFIRANIVTSIYGRSRGEAYLEKAKSEGRLVYSKEEGSAQGITQVQYKSNINANPSSTATIRQTEGNSQEKSSGRASVAGIRAGTADREALRRAEAMEQSGTDNETIRQETGWYRGMDGQWRFEIDDSGMEFRKNGDAQYSTDNADYARYTQLMNRMLTGNLTEAEHAELLGLDKKHGGTKKELARRIDEGDATLRDIMQHNALFEAYPEIAETKVKFAYMPNGTAGSYSRETNTITIDAKLKYDANEALDVLMHEVQHRVQAAEGFASGTNPGYWNRGENYDRAAEKYRDNRARLLNGLSTEDRALYDEYRSTEREMGAMFDGSMLYDESRMDALEKRSDELYKQLYGKEWFGKLNRYDRILGDAGEAVNEFYRNTAGEIEARDTASRRRMTAEERKNTPPNLGDADTVFADGNTTSYSIDENFGKNVDDWVRNTPTDMLSTSPGYFRVGTTSEALQSIGARTDNIYMRKSKIGTIFEDHPEVNVDVIKKVPSILENPVLIMKSLTRPDSIVLLSEEKAKNGNSLMVALELTPKPGGRTEAEFSLVTSAYGRADENLRNLINNSELLYLDTNKNRANTWLMQLRVQFPSRQPPYGSIGNIAYAEDGVKITGKKLSELGGVIQKASSGKASVEVENRKTEVSEEDARRERLRKLQEADRRETERIRARENLGAGQRFVPNKSSGEVYRDLMGEGKSEVKVQMTGFLKGTPKDSTFKVEVKQTPIGKYYEATIFHDGHKADTLVRALKETAARDAAEEVITMANKNFSEENYQRAKKFEAEKTADEDARIAELFGDPEQPDNAETSRESSDAAETENAAAKETIAATTEKVTSEVIKAERNYREDFEKITSGAMRMFVNAGDTVRRIAKATGSKSLEGYYFNAGAYSQRAGNWIAKGGARTDIDGHRIGASLADTLAPMRKNETKYRDFQLYLLHMHNVDRMKYDNSAELERIKENLRWVKEKYPQLKELSKEELRRIANSDSDSPVVRQAAHEIYLAAHNGEAPSLTSVAEGAAYALELERQRAIVEKQGLKPVFGYDVTADDSQTAAMLLAAKNPEFKEWAKEVYKYSDDLIRYRVEAGLITREFADALKKRYPHYIPTFREEGTSSKKARSARRNGGIVVSNAIGRAVGSDGVLLPLHTALSRKTVSTMRNAGLNQFGLALVREYDGNKKATEKYIWDVAESEYTPTEAALESDEDYRPVFENIFSVKENGKAYDITMDEGLTAAMKAFEPDKFANYGAAKAMKKLNDVFKAMNTAWSPWFLIKNAVRDFQDAGFYSTDMKTWLKMFPQAKRQIRKNGEIWQQYKALGGSYSSMLDYTTGMVKEPKNKLGKLWARFELLQQQVEAAPRLAEFMTILANSGGSKDGKFTQNDLMEAMLGAADITTNFARGGSVTKMLNRYLVPFLNPSVQGFDKFIRNATGVRSVQAAGKLILSAALWGILPQILNELMWWDDDEWDDIPANTKSNYYLIKLPEKFFGSGYWVKIPKGRAAAVLGTLAVYGKEKIEGEDVKFSDVFEVIKSNIAPTDIFNQNIATAFTQTKLFNPDNPGTTWYGGNIESDRLQNYRPGDRYDEKTDELSKLIGKTFNLSPKKINYLLDQYTGIFGDILLPLMTPATNAASKLLSAPMAAFTIDTTSTNKTTGEYYDLLDDLKYDANDGDVGAGITRKYVSRAGDEVNDYYAQIRALQNDKNLSDGEKNRLVRALKKQLIERQKEIIAKAEPYREAVDKYLKAHPELATDNDAAIAEYAELYDITEDQAESRMDAIVYRECNREVFGAEYALRTYNADVYDKARTAYAKGVSYETYYDYYFATKEMHADKDENGKSISGSKKAKVVEYINSLDIPAEQKDALYVAAGYTEKSARYQKWNGGSGGSGSRRGSSGKTTLKAPTPKAGKIVIPEASAKTGSAGKSSGNALAPSSKTAKTSGNVIADFTQKSSGTDIRKAVTQAKKRAIKAGNRTLYVEEGSPIDYFLKYGKLPSVK